MQGLERDQLEGWTERRSARTELIANRALFMNGLLVIDKPSGWTSHDVVAKVRRLTGVRRVGHAGTLDPAATGVLPLGIGQGTRVLEYLGDAEKSYRGVVRLGLTTTTDDAEGEPLEQRDWQDVTEARVRDALNRFTGGIEQVPPMFSAIKRGGVPLHKLARAGVEVERQPRRVRINRIELLRLALPDLEIDVDCSKGTYIRTLARDIGDTLGCGAHLAELRRTRHGPFTLAEAVTMTELQEAADQGWLEALLLAPDLALLHARALVVDELHERLLLTGRVVDAGNGSMPAGQRARVYGADGTFLAVAQADGEGRWRPEKVFADAV
jgi:tRNA pseudouridine55 synthase